MTSKTDPLFLPHKQAYQRLQIQQQMLQAQRNVSGPIRQQEQQVSNFLHAPCHTVLNKTIVC